MTQRSLELAVVSALAFVAAAVILVLPSISVLDIVLGTILVLVLPGYALTAAVFARREIDVTTMITFGLGLSLATVIVGGVLLDLLPFGMNTRSWSVFLVAITVAGCAVSYVRQPEQLALQLPSSLLRSTPRFNRRSVIFLSLAAVLVAAALVFSAASALQQERSQTFTQLWILPDSTFGQRQPPHDSALKLVVHLGIRNQHLTAERYYLTVTEDGHLFLTWPAITLPPDGQWGAAFVVPFSGHGDGVRLEAQLYRANDRSTVYRHVALWVPAPALTKGSMQ